MVLRGTGARRLFRGKILIRPLPRPEAEANGIEGYRGQELKVLAFLHPLLELLGQGQMFPELFLESFNAIIAKHKPQLEGTKASPQLDSPVSVVGHLPVKVSLEVLR
jgi:hypothetical protein